MFVAAGTQLLAVSHDVALRKNLTQLPTRLGNWTVATDEASAAPAMTGVSERLVGAYPTPAGELRFAGVDDQLVREYRDAQGVRIQLYVGYYRRQEEGKELTNHASAQLRLAGSTVALPDGHTRIGEVIGGESTTRKGIVYWYDVGGRIADAVYVAKAYSVWNSLTRGRSDGAIVMIGWQEADRLSADEARRRALDFAQELIPVLREFLPA
jgi:EpsI family protein